MVFYMSRIMPEQLYIAKLKYLEILSPSHSQTMYIHVHDGLEHIILK